MFRHVFLLLFCCLSILSGCNSDDQSTLEERGNLALTVDNIKGDWKRIAQLKGQPNDSLGVMEPLDDMFT